MKYKKMSFISGVVIFFSFVIILVTILWLADKRIFFTSDYKIFVKFDDVIGLRDHSQVYMRGYRVGWTKGVKFEKDGVVVRVDVKKKYRIPADSKFEINTLNFMGEKAITIKPGISDEFLQAGDLVKGKNKDIMIEAKEILDTIKERIKKKNFEDKIAKVSRSLDLLHNALVKINDRIDKVNVAEYNRQIKKIGEAGDNLTLFIKDARKELNVTAEKGRESIEKVDKLVENLSNLTKKLDEISDKLNNGKGSAGKLLNDEKYIENLNKTIEELKNLITDIKKNPKKYVKLSIF